MIDPILVEVGRGPLVESRHRGAVAVSDAAGHLLVSLGDTEQRVLPRSAVKGLQALPLIESGAAERYGLTSQELALACASHSGEPGHVETARGLLAKVGRDEGCLECGTHWPREPHGHVLAATGGKPGPLHNNCSGKHAGFICQACAHGEDPRHYIDFDHPVQRRVRATLAEVYGIDLDRSVAGTDGCSIPTYAVPLAALARGFARFGTGEGMPKARAEAATRLRAAAAAAPWHVAGTKRFDTRAMTALGARLFVKTGAEGVHCAALPEHGLGIALKCDDGAGRAAEVIMASLVRALLPLAGEAAATIDALAEPGLVNWNGMRVGEIRAAEALRSIQILHQRM